MDFTLATYSRLLNILLEQGFSFQSFIGFMQSPKQRVVILRHDVDRLPFNALKTARMEYNLGIPASYYFRTVSESWDEEVIRQIAALGHEIGYHYENLSFCMGNSEQAWADFTANLAKLRELASVTTICMHGSPLSQINNLDLWKTYDYKELAIIGEPYIDVDFDDVFYITDTGRKWNNVGSSVRDKVDTRFKVPVKSTEHLMTLARQGKLPGKIMINTHPQRWEDSFLPWIKELVWQNVKNFAKNTLVRMGPFMNS